MKRSLADTQSGPAAHAAETSFVEAYEKRLSDNSRWALTEGSIFFEGQGAVQRSLRQIAKRLKELGISYAIVSGMALFQHGVRRFTEDVDILVTREDLREIHLKLMDGGKDKMAGQGDVWGKEEACGLINIGFWGSGIFVALCDDAQRMKGSVYGCQQENVAGEIAFELSEEAEF